MPRRFAVRSRLLISGCVALCVTALGPAATGTAATPVPHHDDLSRQAEQLVHEPGGPPGVIAVLRWDRHTRVVRAGVADLATGRRPAPHDHMRIASTAKAFSGALVNPRSGASFAARS